MTEPVDQLPPELADKCFGSLTSTSKARILPQGDHACYELQRSLEKVSPGFHRKVGGITGREVLVLLHYAADDELSPTRFIPVVSIRMIEILNLSQQEKERLLAADISICDQSRDGKSASQNATITIAVVTLDALTFWIAVLASRQYARRSTTPLELTITIQVWNVDRREDLYYAVSLLNKESVRLVVESNGNRLDGQEIWELQHGMTALHAVILRKSLLDHALRHGQVLEVFKNESALQNMCCDVMQHLADVGPNDPLGEALVPILCSLLLTWASRYWYEKSIGKHAEETEEQSAIKSEIAHCEATSCPCVMFHLLRLPEAHVFTPSPASLLSHGIDEPAWRELCRLSSFIHDIHFPHDDAGHTAHRQSCLERLREIERMSVEDDPTLAHDIEVLSVAVEHGLEGLASRRDMPLALPIPEDSDLVERLGVWNRLSVCARGCQNLLWLYHEGSIRQVEVSSKPKNDLYEVDVFDKTLIGKLRDSKSEGFKNFDGARNSGR
jgi:hypothetical protein